MTHNSAVASRLEEAVTKYQQQMGRAAEDEPDPTTKRILWTQLERDSCDLRYIADLVRAGNIRAAKRVMAKLDTAVREEVPSTVYRFVMDNG